MMPDTHPTAAATPDFDNETASEQQARIKREASLIAGAEAEIDAGYWLDEVELDAWLKAVAVDPNAPLPGPKNHRP